MAPATTHRPKTGRPPHAVWAHFIKGEKRNGSHHHVYCRYCSDAQAQALAAPANPAAGPLSIEAIRGVPTKMLRHLSICIYCPASTRIHIRSMADEHAAGPSRKRRRTPEPEAMVPPQPLLDLLLSDGPVRPSAPPVASEKRSAAIALPPDDALVQVALGGHVSWAWVWNPDVSKLLTVNVPDPDVLYERCLRHRAGDPPSMPFASLSVASWTSLCSREFTIACTLQYLHSCTTISIASIAPTLEACLAHLTGVVASSPPLVAILVDSALLLEAAMAALPQCTVLFVLARSFDSSRQSWRAMAAHESDVSAMWSTLDAAHARLEAPGVVSGRDALLVYLHLTRAQSSWPLLPSILSKCDGRLWLLAYALHTATDVDLFEHWLHVGAAVRHYALQWHLDANAVVTHVLELRRGQFPFDSATKALYAEDVCSYYAFLSESHPELHAFCIRLFSIAPACARYEMVLPGLFDAGISPFLARIDIPAQAQCAIVKYSEHSTKRPSAYAPQVLSVDDWLQLRPEIQAFVQSEVDAFATLPITSASVDLTVFSSCDDEA
ncbi:hypothetical protein SPRG_05636 [Saprolegnia parasitica CBS 223.65]|uniref:Uncharacterized protein n=1 Tax=Saprolegnia parasitica (strain CBS 223.65) TaxID=695850 RepID=A0A067CG46_SAPPC|nr:hypothetical protein SPRG_05636 [Saprolegnia parasitica CBS 223.65]KDO29684.1 hypothetical protein SPRG_05636 [Saprolegnia parasitica CBS 223.65]|eukprot:XP_012199742.1 hypothetical protein SPRG_05636 [Saprolegnia parasitica CBS 223.65]